MDHIAAVDVDVAVPEVLGQSNDRRFEDELARLPIRVGSRPENCRAEIEPAKRVGRCLVDFAAGGCETTDVNDRMNRGDIHVEWSERIERHGPVAYSRACWTDQSKIGIIPTFGKMRCWPRTRRSS